VITLILFGSQETFLLIIINVENRFAALYFCGNLVDPFQESLNKEQHLFKMEIFCNVIMSLLSLLINLMHKKYGPQTFER